MVKSGKCCRLFTVLVAIIAAAAVIQVPVFSDSDESYAADPTYVRNVTIKVFDQDSTDYSDLAYLSDKLPVQFNAAEWVRDASGLWYNINDRSSDCGKVLRYGAVTNITNEEIRSDVLRVMEVLGYRLESEKEGSWAFLRRSGVSRALKMWEDRITLTASAAGLEVEGLTRDLMRVVSALEATRPDA